MRTYGIVGEHAALAAPSARRAAGFAELLSSGADKLPASALWAMLVAALFGVLFAVLEQKPGLKRWTPSPTGLSLGMLLPFAAVASLFVGGAAGAAWQTWRPASARTYLVPLASGLIAGETMVAVVVPVLLWLGLGHP